MRFYDGLSPNHEKKFRTQEKNMFQVKKSRKFVLRIPD
jgi:hypothetical protein